MPHDDVQPPHQDRAPEPGLRTDGSAIAALLARCRRRLDRVQPRDLADECARGALVVDIRPLEQRSEGALPGAVVIDRNVLEWRLDPTSPYRIAEAADPERRVIVVCNEGFSSSLAAYTLQQRELRRATDLDGGYRAWLRLTAGTDAASPRTIDPA